uniref:Uncharacterized protein n=1 Tax=Tanacetum cinerariifolium TaxID=118510 RepID=A0A6L2MGA4_TANCI|nr:hypothetical protein [Tanacetum cinerariifolium]
MLAIVYSKDKIKETVEVPKPYEWAVDEWYYERKMEDYKAWKAKKEELAREKLARDQIAREQRLLQLAREHEEELATSRSYYNLFEDDAYQDESYDNDKDDFEALYYEEVHLVFDREKSPKFHF